MSDKARKLICALLAVILFTEPFYGGLMNAYATSTTDKIKQAEQEKKNAEQQLGQTQSTLNQLKDSKKAIQNSLNNLNEQLDETSDKMDDLQAQIDEKQANIEAVEKEYEDAVAQAAEQYKFIKVRIKKIYESGSDSIYDLLFNSSSMADFLNKAVYIAKMNDYDDKMLAKMKALQEDAAEKKEILMEEDEELRRLYNEMEEEAGSLQDLVDSTENSLVSYAGAISEKEKEALAYEAKLLANQQTISQLKSKLAEEEALAKQAEKMEFRDLSEVSVAAGDRDLLAAIIQCEAGGEPYAGKIAVGAVIMNRVRSAAFPNTIAGVVYQPMQFQPVRSGRLAIRLAEGANETCYKAADEVLAGANNIGKCLFFRTVVPGINGTVQSKSHLPARMPRQPAKLRLRLQPARQHPKRQRQKQPARRQHLRKQHPKRLRARRRHLRRLPVKQHRKLQRVKLRLKRQPVRQPLKKHQEKHLRKHQRKPPKKQRLRKQPARQHRKKTRIKDPTRHQIPRPVTRHERKLTVQTKDFGS